MKKIMIGIIIIFLLAGAGIFTYYSLGYNEDTWTITTLPGGDIEFTITQRMIDVVGTTDSDAFFSNYSPEHGNFVVFQETGIASHPYNTWSSQKYQLGWEQSMSNVELGMITVSQNAGETPVTITIGG